MERKIGEIFEYNDEFFQCVNQNGCCNCAFYNTPCHLIEDLSCNSLNKKRKEKYIFKKLEKVGEPFERNGYMYQEYKTHIYPLLMSGDAKIPTTNGFAVIIKQNKEDMKTVKISKDDFNFLVNKIRYGILPKHTTYDEITNEISNLFSVDDTKHSNSEKIGKNLKEFNLEAAKSGKSVCTRSGKPVRIICFDVKGSKRPIIALVKEDEYERVCSYMPDGRRFNGEEEWSDDLMMLPEKKEGWVNIDKGGSGKIAISSPYSTKEEAIHNDNETTIDTIKISWEE